MSFTRYRLRVTDGERKGLWLAGIDVVTNGGIPFRGDPNWLEVSLYPDRFRITPRFHEDETWAWLGITEQNAQTHRTILANAGIQTEIVKP